MEVEFAVLGELRVVIGGIDVTPRAPKERALLAVLAIDRGQVVAVDRLLEELWPALPPDRGRRVLQVRVAEIRRQLARAGAASLLESVPPGYRLHLGGEALDVDRFAALVEQGRALMHVGDVAGAAVVLRRALGLWRGDAFVDAQGCVAVENEAVRLEESQLAAIETWVQAELALGHHAELCGELDALVTDHPFREGLWAQWMLALYRTGRQADALHAYQRVRRLLDEELGIEPGLELRDLEEAILLQKPELDWPGLPQPVASPDGPFASGVAGPARHNLPTVEPLVGRELDLERVLVMMRSHRLVTVTGPPGVGKSSLALAAARVLADDISDGAWLVELAPLGDPSSLVGALAGVLPLPSMPTSAAELVDQIGPRRMLVVLDNCEHLVDDVAVLVSQLMAGCPELRVLCTSQETLAVDREHVWLLGPLADAAAMALFDERARAVRPEVVDDRGAVATIVRRLDGLPLAIELAAAKVATFSPAEIAAQLDDRFRVLSGGGLRGRHPRHRALAAMVDWGHELLEPGERRLFRRLGVFSGSFTRDAAVDITNIEAAAPAAVADDLDHLVRRSLVVADIGYDATRYRLLETLRFYALDRLAGAGETEKLGRRHAHWYTEFASVLAPVWSPEETAWLQRGIAEWDNLRGAVAYALVHTDTNLAVRLVGPLWRLGVLWRAELLDWARHVLSLPGAADHPDVGYVHLVVAILAWITGGIDESLDAAEHALRRSLDEDGWSRATMIRVTMLGYRGRGDEGAAAHRAALKEVSSPQNRTLLLALAIGGESVTGTRSPIDVDQVIADADASGNPGLRSFTRAMVALALVARHESDEAMGLLHEALEIGQPGLNRWAVGISNEILALAEGTATQHGARGDLAERAARALDLTREYPMGLGFAVIGLTVAAHRHGHVDEAALLTGYVTTHLAELLLTVRGAEVMAGAPLDRFVTPATHAQFLRGQAMTPTELHAELERLAGQTSV